MMTAGADRTARELTNKCTVIYVSLIPGARPKNPPAAALPRVWADHVQLVPNDPSGDALHLALASFYKSDVLLTWNCRHLANPNKWEHMRAINYALGLQLPLVTTPLNYFSAGEDDA